MRISDKIPFEEAGIDRTKGEIVSKVIDRLLAECPNRPIDIQNVSESSGVPSDAVKRVLYLLLGLRLLKATFLPRHRACDRVIGEQELSVQRIIEKAQTGQYGPYCMLCTQPIDGEVDIEVQILFWKPGANVER